MARKATVWGVTFKKKSSEPLQRLKDFSFHWEDPTGARNALSGRGKGIWPIWGRERPSLGRAAHLIAQIGFLIDFSLSAELALPWGLEGPGDLEGQELHFLECAEVLELERKEQGGRVA